MTNESPPAFTAQAVIDAIEALPPRDEAERSYIGASSVGNACDAFLAFSLRGFPGGDIDARKERIFRLGHLIETEVVRLLSAGLRASGLGVVMATDQFTGRQFAMTEAGGHVAAHMDGQVLLSDDEVIGLEIKSMNEKSFSAFRKDGVKSSHPIYYSQMQMMMAMGGHRRFLIVAYNKNTSELWAEVVDWDPIEWDFQHVRIEHILNDQPVSKIASDEDDWRCRGCFKAAPCWRDAPVPEACRTCANGRPDIASNSRKAWICSLDEASREANYRCDRWARWRPRPK